MPSTRINDLYTLSRFSAYVILFGSFGISCYFNFMRKLGLSKFTFEVTHHVGSRTEVSLISKSVILSAVCAACLYSSCGWRTSSI